ncbi:hypothetical protein N7E81_09310 [Reichenbachiella carrageenanivorans]|uniref:DUF5689 domain-containing protein n=1 Tax=Reichenbachiella carrageenanivorans TaxID=2979869 RepID=A0ABY6D552_9BACT|nr:hypothetical protein [Reichenbachiella carrageenanivorans]UXX81287.1 hypothetical protein N7E81_09310 [Reichenbachiella carrageenanivorans]
MKKYGVLMVLVLLVISSCGEEFNTPVVIEPSHSVIKVSQSSNGNILNVGGSIDFADVSQGISSREWVFPSTDVEIEGEITDSKVKVTFLKVGSYEVELHQEFMDSAYVERGDDKIGMMYDTTIAVTVMPAVEVSALKANLLDGAGVVGTEIDLDADTPTEIPFGSIIRYAYTATGNPTEVIGDFDGAELVANDSENSTFDVKYNGLDKVFSIFPVFRRPQPESRDTLYYTDIVKCVRSTEPVTLIEVYAKDSDLGIEFSRGLDKSSVKTDQFSVTITTAGSGDITPEFEAKVDPNNSSVVLLTMTNDEFYSDDMVKVTYSGASLETADKAPIDPFADEEATIIETNLLEEASYDYDMEDAGVTWVAGTTGWLGGDFTNTLEKTTVRATKGTTSLKISVDPYSSGAWGNGTIVEPTIGGALQRFPYTSEGDNKVKVAYDVFLEANGGGIDPSVPNQFATNMRMYINWGAGGTETAQSLGGSATGAWQELTDIVTISDPGNAPFSMAIKIAQTGEEVFTAYIDNIRVTRWNPRP